MNLGVGSVTSLRLTIFAILLPTPKEFATNPDIYPTGKLITKQLIDIKIHVDVQDFIAEEYRNRITGTRLHAPFPKGLIGATENESHLTWHKKMHSFLQKMIHTVKRSKRNLSKEKIAELTERYESILNLASLEYEEHPPDLRNISQWDVTKFVNSSQANRCIPFYV